jgi:hypothetical protein
MRRSASRAEEGAVEVNCHHPPPCCVFHLLRQSPLSLHRLAAGDLATSSLYRCIELVEIFDTDSGVVNEDVQTSEVTIDLGKERLDARAVRDVRGYCPPLVA